MATAWRLAKSLETLRAQVNSAYPKRSKASDGTIGDYAHSLTASDHNPNKNGVVCALDLTHDPANGFHAHALAERLRTNRHPNLRYIISNARIAGWWTNWEWQPSSGHISHIHISVGTLGVPDGQTYDRYDSTVKWNIKQGEEMITLPVMELLARVLNGRSSLTAAERAKVGKITVPEWIKLLDSYETKKKAVEKAKSPADFTNHLVKTYRDSQAQYIKNLQDRNKELEAKLAAQSDDTKNLNAFGELLRWFIQRLGLKG